MKFITPARAASLTALLLSAGTTFGQTTIAKWTFETSAPATAGPFNPEQGAGSASGSHSSGAAVYSSPVGNASPHSFSCNTWTVGDYFQFQVSTTGLSNLVVTYDQISSSTGPGQFNFAYSTDGTHFTNFVTPYTVIVNASPDTWSSTGTPHTSSSYSNNLSSIPALNNLPAVYFRLVDASTTSAGNGTVATAGTSRTDNFTVSSATTMSAPGGPTISQEPASTFGVSGGVAQFAVTTPSVSPTFQWYFSDLNTNIIASVANGTQPSGSFASGATTSILTLTNLKASDPTNFLVVVTTSGGSVTSSVASLLSVSNTAYLAFWNFNQANFLQTLGSPAAYFGVGTATAVSSAGFSGATDPSDNGLLSYIPLSGLGGTNFAWGSSPYPATNVNPALASNKLAGVQFAVSTLGARNIMVSYDARVSPTASEYERLQYTTNGTTWIDYPSSSTFNGNSGTGNAGFYTFSYNLTGFPGVDNNSNFAFRVVTEFEDTATYEVTPVTNYVGTANGYGNTGTITYDLVYVSGSSITSSATPPTVSLIPDTNTLDYVPLTLSFTVTDTNMSPDFLTYSAVALDIDPVGNPVGPTQFGVSPGFSFGGSGANRTLTITPNAIPAQLETAPIQITVYDAGSGASAATSFLLTLTTGNLAPTNTLTSLPATNLLANSSITIPFSVSDDRTPVSGLTYTVASKNNTVLPASGLVVNNQGTANPSLTIAPGLNQIGVGLISVSVIDNDSMQPSRTTTATIAVSVLPNTNVVLADYFNYDNSGALDVVGSNFWGHLTGITHQLAYTSPNDMPLFGNGYATVDTFDNSENLQAPLLNAPFLTSSTNVLYMSFLANMNSMSMPILNGSYFILFNDGSGATGPYACRVMAATNGAAPGFYRLGVANIAATSTNAQMYPMDLSPDTNYTVVASEVLATGQSTLWINPISAASPSVTDTTSAGTNLYNLSDIELRESGGAAGSVHVAKLKVGTSFDAVLPSLQITVVGNNAILTSSDPTLGIQASTNVMGPYVDVSASTPYTNNISTNFATYFRFGQ